ncbi:uncharacterized protein LOC130720970 isoform X1 [Lotus japonicus]|uniref:uncharacterized protein LOC130720970 isoform X1 n=1 Tax=Lotus japonicus TaxID=34305 RepID=UPI002587E2E4|nr:uncharacterized protein LOC130720970 isoform X1 [Lotus japonicus]
MASLSGSLNSVASLCNGRDTWSIGLRSPREVKEVMVPEGCNSNKIIACPMGEIHGGFRLIRLQQLKGIICLQQLKRRSLSLTVSLLPQSSVIAVVLREVNKMFQTQNKLNNLPSKGPED